jgi:hypothetical protein
MGLTHYLGPEDFATTWRRALLLNGITTEAVGSSEVSNDEGTRFKAIRDTAEMHFQVLRLTSKRSTPATSSAECSVIPVVAESTADRQLLWDIHCILTATGATVLNSPRTPIQVFRCAVTPQALHEMLIQAAQECGLSVNMRPCHVEMNIMLLGTLTLSSSPNSPSLYCRIGTTLDCESKETLSFLAVRPHFLKILATLGKRRELNKQFREIAKLLSLHECRS